MAKIIFQDLTLKNFLSFGNKPTSINLDTSDVLLIRGVNLDVGSEGQSRNGVGKSTIFQALTWVLFGEGVTNIRQDDFINLTNKKAMSVVLNFTIDDVEFQLTRSRKPNKIELTRAGEPYTLDSTRNIDEAITQMLGFDVEVWLNTYMLTTNNVMFMNLKPAAQRNFIEQLLNLNTLSERADAIKTVLKDTKVDLKLEEQNKVNIETSNTRTTNSLNVLIEKEATWKEKKDASIAECEATLAKLNETDYEKAAELFYELKALEDELATIDDAIATLTNLAETYTTKDERMSDESIHLEGGVCPYCKQQHTDNDKLNDLRRDIDNNRQELEQTLHNLEEYIEVEGRLSDRILRFRSEHSGLYDNEQEITSDLRNLMDLEEKLATMKEETLNPYTEQVDVLQEQLQEYDSSTITELNSDIKHGDVLVKLLTDSKSYIRKSLIEQYLSVINKTINTTLDKIGSPHEVIVNPDLTVDIAYMGNRISFGNLSNGERLRVNVAVSLAFREVMSIFGVTTNVLFIDEILDNGGDAGFMYNVFEMLHKDKCGVFLISHRDELTALAGSTMMITKKKGFSSVEID